MNSNKYSRANVTLRPARLDDVRSLFNWRNMPAVRENSFHSTEINWDEHYAWFKNFLQQKNRVILIGEIDSRPFGVLRYDINNDVAKVHIYLLPGLQGNGLGSRLLCAGQDWLSIHFGNIKNIVADILPDNLFSQKAFKKAGFKESHRVFSFTQEEITPD